MVLVDLRSAAERRRQPRESDIQIEVPPPPLNAEAVCWLAETILAVAADLRGAQIGVFCARGVRSGLAASILRATGYNVVDLGAA
jgi:rhodanese-related sulfurtransferase